MDYGWFFELCEKLKSTIEEVVKKFSEENNFEYDIDCEFKPYHRYICYIYLTKKLEKTEYYLTLHLVVDLDTIENIAVIKVEKDDIKIVVSKRRSCKKLNPLKRNLKNAIKSIVDQYISKYIYEDKRLLFLDEVKRMVGKAGNVERYHDYFYITIGKDKIVIDTIIEKGEVAIRDLDISFNTNLKKILFLDIIVNTYGWKHLIRYVGKTTVTLDLLDLSKEEQMNILDKVIELVKMYNLFT